jgi:hypothetical protein
MTYEEALRVRGEYNAKLLLILSKLIKKHPELRFGQILYNFSFITKPLKEGEAPKLFDPFNEEPVVTFHRVCRDLEKWGHTDILNLVK